MENNSVVDVPYEDPRCGMSNLANIIKEHNRLAGQMTKMQLRGQGKIFNKQNETVKMAIKECAKTREERNKNGVELIDDYEATKDNDFIDRIVRLFTSMTCDYTTAYRSTMLHISRSHYMNYGKAGEIYVNRKKINYDFALFECDGKDGAVGYVIRLSNNEFFPYIRKTAKERGWKGMVKSIMEILDMAQETLRVFNKPMTLFIPLVGVDNDKIISKTIPGLGEFNVIKVEKDLNLLMDTHKDDLFVAPYRG